MSSCLPLLVFDHHPRSEEDGINEMLMYSISKRSLHKNMEPGLLAVNNVLCWTTPQGWMIVTEEHDPAAAASAWLWNPCTGDKLPLPDIGDEIPFHLNCMLTHKDPTHPGCVAVLFSCGAPGFWYYHTAGGGAGGSSSSSWRHHSYNIGNYPSVPEPPKGKKARRRRSIRPDKKIICDMASFRGKIYFTNYPKGMRAIDFSSCTSSTADDSRPMFQKFNIPAVDLPEGLCSGREWLVESQDQLFAVSIGFVDFNPNNIGAIEVHRMDSSLSTTQARRWHRVRDIGDVVFLLEETNRALSCSASTLGLKANQIYFMKNFL